MSLLMPLLHAQTDVWAPLPMMMAAVTQCKGQQLLNSSMEALLDVHGCECMPAHCIGLEASVDGRLVHQCMHLQCTLHCVNAALHPPQHSSLNILLLLLVTKEQFAPF